MMIFTSISRNDMGVSRTSASNRLVGIGEHVDTSELDTSIAFWLRRASRQVLQAHVEAKDRLELKSYEFAALALIGSNPGITSSQLADQLDIHRSNFVHVLRGLELAGYVARCASPEDGRASGLVVTQMGKDRVHRFKPLMQEVEASGLGGLSAIEIKALLQLLKQMCLPVAPG